MARFLVEILINAAGGPKARASFDDIGASAGKAAQKIDAASVQSERALRRTAEAAQKLKEQMMETAASKGLVADMAALNTKLQQQISAYKEGGAALTRWEQKQKEAAQAQRILTQQVKAGVSADSIAGKEIADKIRLYDRLQTELHQTVSAQQALNRSSAGGVGGASLGSSLMSGAAAFAAKIAVVYGAVLTLKHSVSGLIDAASESEAAFAQLQAGVTSTGGSAGFTARQLDEMATQISHLTGKDDELIAQNEAVMLTFERIKKGNFFDAVTDAMDLAQRKSTDLGAATTLVGKAYSGNVEGLKKAGVVLSESQKKQLKDLFATGHAVEAQTRLHELLQKAVGGSAVAYRNTLGGALEAAKTETGNLVEIIAGELSPAIKSLVEDYIKWATSAETQKEMAKIGKQVAEAIDGIVSVTKLASPALHALWVEFKLALEALSAILKVLGWVADKISIARDYWQGWAQDISGVSVNLNNLSFDFDTVDSSIEDNLSSVSQLRQAYGDLTAAQLESARAGLEAMTARRDALAAELSGIQTERAELMRRNPQLSSNTGNKNSSPFSLGGQQNAEANAKLNDMLARERDLAEESGNLSNIIEKMNGRLAGHAKAAKTAADEEDNLSDKMRKARESAQKMMDALEREAGLRAKLFVALKIGTEAYREEQRIQSVDAEVLKIKQVLLEAHLPLTEANERAIRKWAGSIFDTSTATEKYNTLLSDVNASLSEMAGITIPKLEIGADAGAVKEWSTSLVDLGFEIDHARLLLSMMPKEGEAYRKSLSELTAREKEYQTQTARLPQIFHDRASARTSEIRSSLMVAESIQKTIKDEIAALAQGSTAWDSYTRHIEAKVKAIQILGVFKLPMPSSKDAEALAEWRKLFAQYNKELESLTTTIEIRADASSAAQLRDSLKKPHQVFEEFVTELNRLMGENLLSPAEVKELTARADEFCTAIRDGLKSAAESGNKALVDSIVGAAFEGKDAWDSLRSGIKSTFQDLASDWLSTWIKAFEEWLSRWLATVAAGKAASAAMGSGAGGGGATNMVQGMGVNGAGAVGMGGTSGGSSGLSSAGAFMGSGSAASALVWVAVIAAVFKIFTHYMETHKAKNADSSVGASGGEFIAPKAQGKDHNFQVAHAAALAVAAQMNAFLDQFQAMVIDGTAAGVVNLRKKNQGKKTDWVVYAQGIAAHFGKDMEAAMDYAAVQGIKNAQLVGLSPELRQAITSSAAMTMDQFQKDLAIATQAVADRIGSQGSSLLQLNLKYAQEMDAEVRLGIAIDHTIEARDREVQSMRDQLLGIDETASKHLADLVSFQAAAEELRKNAEAQLAAAIEQLGIRGGGAGGAGVGGSPGSHQGGDGGGGGLTEGVSDEVKKLREAVERYKAELEKIPKALSQVELSMGVFETLYQYLQGSQKYEADRLKYARIKVELEFASIRAQLVLLGLWEQFAAMFSDAYAAALAAIGRRPNTGSGGGGANQADQRTDLRAEIARLRAEARGGLAAAFLDLQTSIADFAKRAKEAKLPAAEIAEGVALMTAAFRKSVQEQKDAYAGIGTDFTKRLQEMLDFFKQLHKIEPPNKRVNRGPDPEEVAARERFGVEIQAAISAFNGLIDPMAAINQQANELRQGVEAYGKAMGWSAEQIAEALKKIDMGAEFQRQSAISGIVGQLYEYLKDDVNFTADKQAFDQKMLDLQFTLMQAQLVALGAWDEATQRLFAAAHDAASKLLTAGNRIEQATQSISHPANEPNWTPQDLIDAAREAAQQWQQGIQQFTQATQDLLTNDSLTGLTQDQQLTAAQARYRQVQAAAAAGDINALNQLDQARQEYLQEAHDSFAGGAGNGNLAGGFQQVWEEVMAGSASLLSDAQQGEQSAIQRVMDAVIAGANSNTNQTVQAIYAAAQQVAQAIYQSLAHVPGYADGGVVSHRHLAMVGERGPELIIPLQQTLASRIPVSSSLASRMGGVGGRILQYKGPVEDVRGGGGYSGPRGADFTGTGGGGSSSSFSSSIDRLITAQGKAAQKMDDRLARLEQHAKVTAKSNDAMARADKIRLAQGKRGK